MSYNPPANNAVNFDLKIYTAPSNSSVNFEVSGAGPTAYVLNAEVGVFTLSGQPVGTRANRIMVASPAVYTLSGQDVLLRYSRRMPAEVGSFSISGQDVDLRKQAAPKILNAEVGVFTLSGQAVGLYRNRALAAEAREFTLSGQEVLLKFNQVLKAEAAEYLLTGHDVSMYPPHVRIVEKFIAQSRAVTYTMMESRASLLSASQSTALTRITGRSDAIWQTGYTSTSQSKLKLKSVLMAPT
jgi:hypothetical protein